MRNRKSNFACGVYHSGSVLFIFVLAKMQCKVCNRFCDPDVRSISNFHRFVILYMVDYLECLHCQQPFCKQNKFCNVPLNTFCKEWKKKATLGHWKVIYKWYATQAQKFSNYKCMHTKIFDNSSILFFVICLYNPEQPPKTLQSLFVCSNW